MACDNKNPWNFGACDPGDIVQRGLRGGGFLTYSISPLDIIEYISKQLSYLAFLLGLVGFMVGIINLITSKGDKTKVTNGKNIIMMSGLAIIIAILAFNILAIILNIFGFKPSVERT